MNLWNHPAGRAAPAALPLVFLLLDPGARLDAGGWAFLLHLLHLVCRAGFEVLRNADILLKLSHRRDPDDHSADRESKNVPHGLFHRGKAPFPEDPSACRDLHPDDRHLSLHRNREEVIDERGVMLVGCIQGHQDRIEGVLLDSLL